MRHNTIANSSSPCIWAWRLVLSTLAFATWSCADAHGQTSSVSAWEAADFRVWGFVPTWTPQSQLNAFPSNDVYSHVSDVIYFGGVRPTASGDLSYHPAAAQHLATLKSHAAQHDFQLHMSMFTVAGGSVEGVWNSITANPANRANFVSNVVDLLDDNNMVGFNLDWERPNTVSEWANYTQLAKDFKAALGPDREVSVDDFGFADSRWDDSPVFDARTYDQLFIMGYHFPANDGTSLDQQTFADGKLALTGQGAAKAFKDEQLVLGIGTWGANGPATVTLDAIVGVDPNLPYDAVTFSGTVDDLNGVSRTGTWNIESRKQVREKVQLALDRNMAGVMSWTLHYDATNKLSLHRVAHHYLAFQRGVPDMNLDGKVNAADAHAIADTMGTVPGWTGTNTPARFEDFYMSGNWEQGDRDGNGFVNQQDADWLANRFAALGLTVPDRLAYTGEFESFTDSVGISGRWRGIRDGANLRETGNFTQHGPGYLTFAGTGVGADKHSNSSVTIRNQNAAEQFDSLNVLDRAMQVDLAVPLDLSSHQETYFTFLVRENTAPLLASQAASPDRILELQFLNDAGMSQFDFAVHGSQNQFVIQSEADTLGEDVAMDGLLSNVTYLIVAKLSGNGAGDNTMQASVYANGADIGNFTHPGFDWMLTAEGGAGSNSIITQLQFNSTSLANFSISNLWIGEAESFFEAEPLLAGDYDNDGVIGATDYAVWREALGAAAGALVNDVDGGAIGSAQFSTWQANFGATLADQLTTQVPEPTAAWLAFSTMVAASLRRRR